MPRYIVICKANGATVYAYEADEPHEFIGWEFATHDHTEIEPPAPEAQPLLAQPRRMTRLAFVALMTQDEFTSLLEAAKTNTSVEMFIKLLEWATPDPDGTSVDRDDPRTVAGIRALFPPDRADEILGVL